MNKNRKWLKSKINTNTVLLVNFFYFFGSYLSTDVSTDVIIPYSNEVAVIGICYFTFAKPKLKIFLLHVILVISLKYCAIISSLFSFAFFEIIWKETLEDVSIRINMSAITMSLPIFKITFVLFAIFPYVNALTICIIIFELTFKLISILENIFAWTNFVIILERAYINIYVCYMNSKVMFFTSLISSVISYIWWAVFNTPVVFVNRRMWKKLSEVANYLRLFSVEKIVQRVIENNKISNLTEKISINHIILKF